MTESNNQVDNEDSENDGMYNIMISSIDVKDK